MYTVLKGIARGAIESLLPAANCLKSGRMTHACPEMQSHHAARVVLPDNSAVRCREMPVAERDREGNTYRLRALKDGPTRRVPKNFPTESELIRLVTPFSRVSGFRLLENFWLPEYELAACPE